MKKEESQKDDRKLKLSRETIRTLEEGELNLVAGGATETNGSQCCSTGDTFCPDTFCHC